MKGKYHVTVQNRRIRYDFDIRRNITIIRGDSATGKTTLYQMIDLRTNLGDSSGIMLSCEKNCRTLPDADWKRILPELHEQIIFIDEGSRYITSQDFAEEVKRSDNYFVLITREDLRNLPYSVEEIYGIHSSGKYHDLRRTYNEFYRIYDVNDREEEVCPEKVITEDSNSGYQFFSHVCTVNRIGCQSAGGKSGLVKALENADGDSVLAVADGAAIGPEMNDLYLLMNRKAGIKLYLPESFEWIILKSGLIDGNAVAEMLEHPENYADSCQYFSWERFFTSILIRETVGSYLQYQKEKLNPVYLHDGETAAILKVMEHVHLTASVPDH